MRIAVVCPYGVDRPGGVQAVTMELVARYLGAGHESWLVAPGEDPDPALRPQRAAGIDLRLVGPATEVTINRSAAPFALRPAAVRRAKAAIAGADVVHLHEPFAPLTSLGLLRSRVAPLVGTFHAAPTPGMGRAYRVAAPVLRRLADRLAATTAVSVVAAAAVEPLFGAVTIVPNGVDVAGFAPDGTERANRVVFVGRDDERKGLAVLLEAWPKVVAARPGAELVVLGARREAGPAGVEFRGRVPDAEKAAVLRSSTILCCPNTGAESFGIVPLEGMAAGCAVVASAIPAFTWLLSAEGDGTGEPAGVVTPVGDPPALAAALVALLADEGEARRLGDLAVQRARQFDWDMVAARYLELLVAAAG